jgi:L-ascorbate metabolism protein UlaG (beta-lactamase superfamily)
MKSLILKTLAYALLIGMVGTMSTAQDKRIGKDSKFTWLGHAAFKVETPKGKVILIDPWLDNPKAPSSVKNLEKVDLILVTHAHGDHLGNTVELAQQYNATVICNTELAKYLEKKGVKQVIGIQNSGVYNFDGIKVTMVDAKHSSSAEDKGQTIYLGEAAGFIVELENGFTFYHAGDTGLFGDMKLIAEMYKPELVMIPIGGYYTMGPKEAAKACDLLNPKYIIPMHYGTFPQLTGTPVEFKKLLPITLKNKVIDIIPGEFVF